MTLIVGFVHEDFALLFADKKAIAKGPSKLTLGNITIESTQGITLNGYNKSTLNSDKTAVVGIAGNAQSHTYLEAFSKSKNYNESIDVIANFIKNFSSPLERRFTAELEKIDIRQQAIIPFFNSDSNKFCMARFSANEYNCETEALSTLPTHYILRCAGSGASGFIQLVNLPSATQVVNNFLPLPLGKGYGVAEISTLINQFKRMYEAVSCVEETVSSEVDVWFATKECPTFELFK